jgi:hypothetical protein
MPAKEPQVSRWLNELDHSIAATDKLVQELSQQLSLVLMPAVPMNGDFLKACSPESMAPMAERLKGTVEANERTVQLLQGLISRLQV